VKKKIRYFICSTFCDSSRLTEPNRSVAKEAPKKGGGNWKGRGRSGIKMTGTGIHSSPRADWQVHYGPTESTYCIAEIRAMHSAWVYPYCTVGLHVQVVEQVGWRGR
jgi:hypothetical protein